MDDGAYDFPRRRRRSAFGGWVFGLAAAGVVGAAGVAGLVAVAKHRGRAVEAAPATAAGPTASERDGAVGEMVVLGDVGVSLHAVAVERVAVRGLGERGESDRAHVAFAVKVHSRSRSRKVEYDPWIKLFSTHCRLTDDRGNEYRPIDFGIFTDIEGRQETLTAVYPGEPVSDRLVFQRPVPAAQSLLLELPGDRVGATGTYRFRVPASAWK